MSSVSPLDAWRRSPQDCGQTSRTLTIDYARLKQLFRTWLYPPFRNSIWAADWNVRILTFDSEAHNPCSNSVPRPIIFQLIYPKVIKISRIRKPKSTRLTNSTYTKLAILSSRKFFFIIDGLCIFWARLHPPSLQKQPGPIPNLIRQSVWRINQYRPRIGANS